MMGSAMVEYTNLPALGVGLTYVPGIEPLLEADDGLIDVLEIEPQTLWFGRGAQGFRVDEGALERIHGYTCAKLLHGVGFPVGGIHLPDPAQIPVLRQMIETLGVPWISEHLGFNRACGPDGEFNTGFLLPPRLSHAGVLAAVRSIRAMAEDLPIPLAVETSVSYLRPRSDEMLDGRFVANVAETADCGILLDLHNIWTNQVNGRQSINDFVASIPVDRVWEVHVAGGTEHGEFWLDAHAGPIPPALVELAENVIPKLPNLRAIIYEISPSYLPVVGLDVVRDQLRIIRALWQWRAAHRSIGTSPVRHGKAVVDRAENHNDKSGPTPAIWEDTLAAAVVGRKVDGALGIELASDPGIAVIRELVGEFRASMIIGTLKLTSRLLMLSLGTARFKSLLIEYWHQAPPQLFGSAEADGFAAFLRTKSLPVAHLEPVLAFEQAVMATLIDQQCRNVKFDHNPMEILGNLGRGRLPGVLVQSEFELEITPQATAPASA
jgi:uncharacterized protein